MRIAKRVLIIASLVFIAAGAGSLWVATSGWPIIRNAQYRDLIVDFQRAQHIVKISQGDASVGWDFQVRMPERKTTAVVRAAPHGVVRVRYENEGDHRLYEYVDYSSPVEIRATDNVLYVHWVEMLIRTDHWLLAYDLASRREIVRRRIDPGDLARPY